MTLQIRVSTKQAKQYYKHREDISILGRIRNCAPCPAVWAINEPKVKTVITVHWQIALCVWNYGIRPKQVMAELGCTRALANKTGYGCSTPRRNWITGENLSASDPLFDKDRTMSRSMLMSKDGIEHTEDFLFRDYKDPDGSKKIYKKYIILKTFNGNLPPPVKPGKSLPPLEVIQRGNYVDYFDNYLYNPRDDWEMFFALNIVNAEGLTVPFAGGALYPWFFNGNKPVCFFPHVSTEDIKYPTELLTKLPLGTSRINPYTK
jgi:hypothetical protein